MRGKVCVFFFILSIIFCVSVQADVIRMKDGVIFIGKILSIDSQGVEIEAFGEKSRVKSSEIIKTEPDFNNLRDQNIEITCKDNSFIQGKIKNYDVDVGFLVELNSGITTVPLENIKRLVDPVQGKNYTADSVTIGVNGGYYFVLPELSSVFGNNAAFTLFFEFNLAFIAQGLFAGAAVSYYNMYCTSSSLYSYMLFNVNVSVIYKFLFWRKAESFVRNIVPYIEVGIGAAFPVNTYLGETGAEVDLTLHGGLGIDFFLNDHLALRVNGAWLTVLQSALPFHTIAVNAGIVFGF